MTRSLPLTASLVALILAALAGSASAQRPPHLSVTGAALLAPGTGQQLYGLNARARLPIASTTKLMTALVTLQHVRRLGRVFTQNNWRPAPGDSQIGLVPGERMNVHDLLVALMLPSADDAAEDLAYNVGHRSVGRFVAMMNVQARRLHLAHTHYTTPIGLDTPGNYSSPADLVRLAAYLRGYSPFLRRVMNWPSAVLHTGRHRRVVVNLNDLLGRIPWINGVKTGHTNDAGYVMVLSGTRGGLTLIGSVLGTSSAASRDANALALLDYGFAHFHRVEPIRRDEVLARLPVQGSSGRAGIISEHRLRLVVPKNGRVQIRLHLPRRLTGPIARLTVVGHAVVFAARHRAARIPLVVAHAVAAPPPATSAARSRPGPMSAAPFRPGPMSAAPFRPGPTSAARFPAGPTTLLWLMLAAGAVLVYSGTRRPRRNPNRRHRLATVWRVEEGQP